MCQCGNRMRPEKSRPAHELDMCGECRRKVGNVCISCGKKHHYTGNKCERCSESIADARKHGNRKLNAKRRGYAPISLTIHELKEAINKALIDQNNCCAVCRISFDKTKYVVDHNHVTGKFRGLLCNHCNWMEGLAKTPEVCLRMAEYIKNDGVVTDKILPALDTAI
jgi:recombination endonuclease VII